MRWVVRAACLNRDDLAGDVQHRTLHCLQSHDVIVQATALALRCEVSVWLDSGFPTNAEYTTLQCVVGVSMCRRRSGAG